MKNLSISILNVENIPYFLGKLKEIETKLQKRKIDNLLDITIHFDVMDNKFVPNNGIDIEKIKVVKEYGYYMDTHLMVEKPIEDDYIDKTIEYGCNDITIHYEIENFENVLKYLIDKKKKLNGNLKIGVSIKPKTDILVLEKYIKDIDKVLVMSVEPGFGGQKYIPDATEKIEALKNKYKDIFVQVDGGVNKDTFHLPVRVNCDSAVVGSYLTKNVDVLEDNLNILNIIKGIEEQPKEANIEFESRTLQTQKGGYAQGDILLGIKVPRLRKLSKMWYNIVSLNTLSCFIKSDIHDYRRFAVFCLVNMVNENNKSVIKEFIDENIVYLNNWDLVDACVPICIGKQIKNESDEYIYSILREYTKSENIWTKRIGIVSLLYIAKENRKEVVFKAIDDVFYEDFHLFQKASGWVLRELYKVNPKDTLEYLVNKNKYKKIPSILKSYATEKMSIQEKNKLK